MSLWSRFCARFGYVRLRDFGLALTHDGNIVPLAGADTIRQNRLLLAHNRRPRTLTPDPLLHAALHRSARTPLPERPVPMRAKGTVPGDIEPIAFDEGDEKITDRLKPPDTQRFARPRRRPESEHAVEQRPAFVEAITAPFLDAELLVGDDTNPSKMLSVDTDRMRVYELDTDPSVTALPARDLAFADTELELDYDDD